MSQTGDRPDGADELLVQPRSSRLLRFGYLLGAALLVLGILVAVLSRGHDHPSVANSAPPSPTIATTSPSASGPSAIGLGHPIPGITGRFDLFARAPNAVLRIDFAAGGIVSTPIPALDSSGPVTFLASSGGAVVRPLDEVPGYLVPDGRPATELDGLLATAAALPGPSPDQVWVGYYTANRLTAMALIDIHTGVQIGQRLQLPTGAGLPWGSAYSDGSGYLLTQTARGLYDLRPDGVHRLPAAAANGTVLATGSDRLLVAGCVWPDEARCRASLVRLPSGLTTPVGTLAGGSSLPAGVISPDCRTALVYQPAVPGQLSARLLDLTTGTFRGGPLPVDPEVSTQGAVYSPDGRWLFVVVATDTLVALDVATGSVHGLGTALPNVLQLAIRTD